MFGVFAMITQDVIAKINDIEKVKANEMVITNQKIDELLAERTKKLNEFDAQICSLIDDDDLQKAYDFIEQQYHDREIEGYDKVTSEGVKILTSDGFSNEWLLVTFDTLNNI